ncbi:SAV0927 family protein [Gracilibacillus saliphilus]|uniref:SAV0927 family protein n=1 Tax=Gracilibacillus saliphilus TaxID=543890 RepID=UPI0013D16513|nr:SAV0927 family protein [Gracilibacillus saliphilus]
MRDGKLDFIKNETEQSKTRLVSFKGDMERFDLAVISSPAFGDDCLVIDLNTNKYSRINRERIKESNFVEHAFQFNELEAEDFRLFIQPLLNEN